MTVEAELPNLLYQGSSNYSINKNKRIIKHEVQSGGCLLGEGAMMAEFYSTKRAPIILVLFLKLVLRK